MHMADALISPAVGGVFWLFGIYSAAGAAKKIKEESDRSRNILTGVLAAFVFAAQMINFSIPGTGSSGHIGGGLLLAILLGRERAFLSMVIILSVQALVFADGGLLALGCNIFNMGFLPCYIAYPYIYKKIAPAASERRAVFTASVLAAVAALELGAFFVVLQTYFSGVTLIPFSLFILLMLPIHLAIAVIEGVCTALTVLYIIANEPSLLEGVYAETRQEQTGFRDTALIFAALAVFIGGLLSWYASSSPDGLEWSIEQAASETAELSAESLFHSVSLKVQELTAFLPDYSFRDSIDESSRLGTSASGLIGSMITLLLAGGLAVFLGRRGSQR